MAARNSTARKRPASTKPAGRSKRETTRRALEAMRRIQQRSVALGLDKMTDEEIEAEIQAARAEAQQGGE
jgi:hypothetical protein